MHPVVGCVAQVAQVVLHALPVEVLLREEGVVQRARVDERERDEHALPQRVGRVALADGGCVAKGEQQVCYHGHAPAALTRTYLRRARALLLPLRLAILWDALPRLPEVL